MNQFEYTPWQFVTNFVLSEEGPIWQVLGHFDSNINSDTQLKVALLIIEF